MMRKIYKIDIERVMSSGKSNTFKLMQWGMK